MYNIFKDVLDEIEKEFNPLRLRYWKPTKPEIIMILILITVLYFGIQKQYMQIQVSIDQKKVRN